MRRSWRISTEFGSKLVMWPSEWRRMRLRLRRCSEHTRTHASSRWRLASDFSLIVGCARNAEHLAFNREILRACGAPVLRLSASDASLRATVDSLCDTNEPFGNAGAHGPTRPCR